MNTWFAIIFSATAIAVGLGVCLWQGRSAGALARVAKYGSNYRLPPLSAEDAASVAHRQRRTARALIAPLIIVVVVMCLVAIRLNFDSAMAMYLIQLVPFVVVLSLVGGVVMALSPTFTPTPGAPLIARSHAVKPRDLVGTMIIRVSDGLSIIGAAVALIAIAIMMVSGFTAGVILIAAIIVVGAAVSMGLRLLERRVIDRPQPVTSRAQLAWDDALSADAVMMLRVAIAQIGAIGVLVPITMMFVGTDSRAGDAVASILITICFVAVIGLQSWFQLTNDARAKRRVVAA